MRREATTMFPKNWNELRIMEEIAFAWKNRKLLSKRIEKGVLVEIYEGKATTGMDMTLIYNDGVLMTATPNVIL